jgi:hypothetical protein
MECIAPYDPLCFTANVVSRCEHVVRVPFGWFHVPRNTHHSLDCTIMFSAKQPDKRSQFYSNGVLSQKDWKMPKPLCV